MRRAIGLGLSALVAGALLLSSSTASALLLEKMDPDDGLMVFTHHYPYPTSFSQIDERYAFDDDPLSAFIEMPYFMPIVVERVVVRQSMVMPRTTFVEEMYESTDVL